MITPTRQAPPRPLREAGAVALARSRAADLEAALILTLLVLAGLVWLLIGQAVMRGAQAGQGPRTDASLQRGLADLEPVSGD